MKRICHMRKNKSTAVCGVKLANVNYSFWQQHVTCKNCKKAMRGGK